MSPEAFEKRLLALIHRQPFEPFVVELDSGRRIVVSHPAVAVNAGGAGFLSDDEGLVDFSHRDVRRIISREEEDATA